MKIANYSEDKMDELAEDGIIRNKLKIKATVTNYQVCTSFYKRQYLKKKNLGCFKQKFKKSNFGDVCKLLEW